MKFALYDAGFPTYKQIKQGQKVVGRVYRKADGTFGAVIGKGRHYDASTEVAAFQLCVARELGFRDAYDLADHNDLVRTRNAQVRREAKAAFNSFYAGDSEPLYNLLSKV